MQRRLSQFFVMGPKPPSRCGVHVPWAQKDGKQQVVAFGNRQFDGKVARQWKQQQQQQEAETKASDVVHALLADLKSCTMARNLEWGKRLHASVLKCGNDSSTYLATSLVNMYAKCGSMGDARQVFDNIKNPGVVSWNVLLLGYTDNGEGLVALELFSRMKSEGCIPDSITYVAALKACASLALKQGSSGKVSYLELGRRIHVEIGSHLNLYVQNSLIDMYAKCGSMADARQVFDSIRRPSVVSWNSLLSGYVEAGEGLVSLELFLRMKSQGCAPTAMTFVAAIKACASLAVTKDACARAEYLEQGKKIHLEVGSNLNLFVQSALVDMYAKYGKMDYARQVFDSISRPNVVSWNALLLGYVDAGESVIALDLFSRMKSGGCPPSSITYVAALKACTSLALKQDVTGKAECRERGRQIHSELGCDLDLYLQNALMEMYAKCGSMDDARQVFDGIEQPSVVSWTTLILGYADSGEGLLALDCYSRMKSQGCVPDTITFVGALKACSLLGALEFGRKVHAEIREYDAILVTCLVDFYAKCGSLVEAQEVFDSHPNTRDLKTWTALLSGYSSFGEADTVFGLFEKMQDGGFHPNAVTYQCILTCCSHAGLVEKATEYFEAMSTKYGITPAVEHYTCMVDVLGRANKLDDAMALLQRMPCNPDAVTWMTVLSACRKWKNVEIGRQAFQYLVSLDERNTAAYILMSHIYASKGMWEEQQMVLGMGKKLDARELVEQTCWTNEVGDVHELLAGDCKHPQIHELWEKVKYVDEVLKKQGSFVSNTKDAEKNEVLCGHSEKLAIACALINTKPGEAIRIVKNFRACDDCHSAIAFVSKLEKRTIFFRDASVCHVFKDGKCSCNGCW